MNKVTFYFYDGIAYEKKNILKTLIFFMMIK